MSVYKFSNFLKEILQGDSHICFTAGIRATDVLLADSKYSMVDGMFHVCFVSYCHLIILIVLITTFH